MLGVWTTRCGSKDQQWLHLVDTMLDAMLAAHGGTVSSCKGIDLRRSSAFVKREVLGARRCFQLLDEGSRSCLSFAFIKPMKCSTILYVTLMASFCPGNGRRLLECLLTSSMLTERFLVVRSTDLALSFYLHIGFDLFNWMSTESFVCGGIKTLSRRLRASSLSPLSLARIKTTLVGMGCIPPSFEEWPLIMRRQLDDVSSGSRYILRSGLKNQPFPK